MNLGAIVQTHDEPGRQWQLKVEFLTFEPETLSTPPEGFRAYGLGFGTI